MFFFNIQEICNRSSSRLEKIVTSLSSIKNKSTICFIYLFLFIIFFCNFLKLLIKRLHILVLNINLCCNYNSLQLVLVCLCNILSVASSMVGAHVVIRISVAHSSNKHEANILEELYFFSWCLRFAFKIFTILLFYSFLF